MVARRGRSQRAVQEALSSHFCGDAGVGSASAAFACDSLTHRFGNARDPRGARASVSHRHVGRRVGGGPATAAGAGLTAVPGRATGGLLPPRDAGRVPLPGRQRHEVAGHAARRSRRLRRWVLRGSQPQSSPGSGKPSAPRRSGRWAGVVELLADLSVHCGMPVTAGRAQACEQAQPVLGGAAGGRGQHHQLHS